MDKDDQRPTSVGSLELSHKLKDEQTIDKDPLECDGLEYSWLIMHN